MSKYEPLEHFLKGCGTAEVPMSFADIERVIGAELPNAAHTHRAWWSNNPSNNVMTRSWLAAGFITERVDMGSQKLVFRRCSAASSPPPLKRPSPTSRKSPGGETGFLDALRARLAGTVTIPDGVDITAPTGEVWDAER